MVQLRYIFLCLQQWFWVLNKQSILPPGAGRYLEAAPAWGSGTLYSRPQGLLNHNNTKRNMCAQSHYFIHVLGILSCWNCWQTHSDFFFFYIGHLVEPKPHLLSPVSHKYCSISFLEGSVLVVNKHTTSDYTEKQGSSTKMAAEIGKQVLYSYFSLQPTNSKYWSHSKSKRKQEVGVPATSFSHLTLV